ALRRRAWRDAVLACSLVLGMLCAVLTGTWIPLSAMASVAVVVVAFERWLCDERTIARLMLRGQFRGRDAPESQSPRVRERLAVVQEQQRGDVVVFPGAKAVVGSGRRVIHNRILIQAALGKRDEDGRRRTPKSFTNAELHTALETALRRMGFPE